MIFLRNVLRARLRSLMTVLGMACGVALFTTIMAISADLQAQIDGVSASYRVELVVMERRASSPVSSRITPGQMAALQADHGDDLAPLVIGTLHEAWNPYALLVGAEPGFLQRVPLVQGAPLAPGAPEVLVGEMAAQRLGLTPGQSVSLGGQARRVAGVFRSGSRLFDSGMLLHTAQAQELLFRDGRPPHYSVAALHVAGPRSPAAVVADLQARHPQLRALPGAELSGALRLVRVVKAFVGTMAAISVVGTVVVLLNTLLMAVAERTREIGILMAVGWSPWRVLRLLAAESLVLAVPGALLGDALALGVLNTVNHLPSVGFGWFPVSLTPQAVGLSLLTTLGVALLALVWPAWVVLRLQPLVALRHE